MTGRVDDIADWLGEMEESRNVFDHTDEATTVISIDVETLAGRISELMEDWYDGYWPEPEPLPWRRLRTAVRVADRTPDTPHVTTPWKPGDTIYELAVGDRLWEYRPEPFQLDGRDAVAYVVQVGVVVSEAHPADYDARCTGTGCPGCEAARRHYKATGCLVAGCPGGHGRVIPSGETAPDPEEQP